MEKEEGEVEEGVKVKGEVRGGILGEVRRGILGEVREVGIGKVRGGKLCEGVMGVGVFVVSGSDGKVKKKLKRENEGRDSSGKREKRNRGRNKGRE